LYNQKGDKGPDGFVAPLAQLRVRVARFPNPPHTVLPELVTIRTDYSDCLSIHRPIHAQYNTDTFLVYNQEARTSAETAAALKRIAAEGLGNADKAAFVQCGLLKKKNFPESWPPQIQDAFRRLMISL